MPESDFDVDTLGTLTLEYFERDASSCSDVSSNVSSSPSHSMSDNYFESPVTSPDQKSSPEGWSDYWSSSHSEGELPCDKVPPYRKGKAKRSVGVKETVLKRNERERKRVKLISEGFSSLRKRVLVQPSNRKLPKLEILLRAIHYIKEMQGMLEESDRQLEMKKQRQKTENCCPQLHEPTQICYLRSPTDEPDNIHSSYTPVAFQRAYDEVAFKQQPSSSSAGVMWVHAYRQ